MASSKTTRKRAPSSGSKTTRKSAASSGAPSRTQPKYLSRHEAAELSGLSVSMIDLLIHRGDLRAYRVGWRVLIPSRALTAFIEQTPITERKRA